MKIDLKQVLRDEANWEHHNFGIVADFVAGLGEGGVVEYPHSVSPAKDQLLPAPKGTFGQPEHKGDTLRALEGLRDLANQTPNYVDFRTPTEREADEKLQESSVYTESVSGEGFKIVPSGRIDYCGDCDKDHGYDCPKDQPQQNI